jgi:arylsulfatase A
LGLREDTIIIFLSDHGHSEEIRNNFGGSGGSAGPFRGHKFTLWEGGIRAPCIVSWLGRVPEDEVRDQKAISIDWLPTIAHYCEVKLPQRKIDGLNIAPMIESVLQPSPHEALHWQIGKQWAVREGNWKLVINGPASTYKGKEIKPEKVFLSNLADDVSETNNLAEKFPEAVERLTRLHDEWAKEVEEQ